MTVPEGNMNFFPEILGKRAGFPRDQSLDDLLYSIIGFKRIHVQGQLWVNIHR